MLPAYGMRIAFDGEAGADVRVLPPSGDPHHIDDVWSGSLDPPLRAQRMVDGLFVTVERGRQGDVRFDWQDAGRWWTDPGAGEVRCWSPGEPGAGWWRMLLDFVLGSVALARGAEALHAGAVVVGSGAVALAAGQGGGKTSLLAELMGRGHELLADDVLVVEPGEREVAAHPAPPVMNLASPRPFPPEAAALGVVVARLADEDWLIAERVAGGSVPLSAVVLLDRGAAVSVEVERLATSPAPLLPYFLESGSAPARRLARFEVMAAVAERVPLFRLRAPLQGALPARLADALLEALG